MKIIVSESQIRRIIKEQTACDVFDSHTTARDYDDVLNDIGNRMLKDVRGSVVRMTPEEYYDRCAQMQETSIEDQYRYTRSSKVNDLYKLISSGEKLALPYLDYNSRNQEGRHRVAAAKKFGCKIVDVAVFLRNGQKDPYYEGWDSEEERQYGLSDLLGRSKDVLKDQEGNPYVVYDFRDFQQRSLFLELYPDFDGKHELLYIAMSKYPPRLEQSNEFKLDNEFYVTEEPQELTEYIKSEILHNIGEEELDDLGMAKESISNYDFNEVYNMLHNMTTYGKLKELYKYFNQMLDSIYAFSFYDYNRDYFEDSLNRNYNVVLDKETSTMRVYSKDKYSNSQSMKDNFHEIGLSISDSVPHMVMKKGFPLINTKYINEYLKIYPLR